MSLSLRCFAALTPGVALCLFVTTLAFAADRLEAHFLGRAWLEALVLAILFGAAIRTAWTPPQHYAAGIDFSAKTLLEVAVVLLGLSVSAGTVAAAGPKLIGGIAAIVVLAIAVSYAIGRCFRLPPKMALLIACGNSICGNSAIAATAPVIRADGDDVAASIAFIAVLGVVIVLALPFTVALFKLTAMQYGIFAGLTVYAVPQVIAATAPVSALSVQIGMLVKLVRVLMLGPVVLVLSLAGRRCNTDGTRRPQDLGRLVPWFIIGFLALAGLRFALALPTALLTGASTVATVLTVVAMAALGLCVDVRVLAEAGARVTLVVVLSLVALGGVSLGFIALIG